MPVQLHFSCQCGSARAASVMRDRRPFLLCIDKKRYLFVIHPPKRGAKEARFHSLYRIDPRRASASSCRRLDQSASLSRKRPEMRCRSRRVACTSCSIVES